MTQHTTHDTMDPARAHAGAIALGVVLPGDDALPPFFHQFYFWNAQPKEHLGRDGHPKVGGLIPDMGLPRRMWAGGRLEFHAPLLTGQPATKTTTRTSAKHKQGRSGPLAFVTLRHDISQNEQLCVTEWQDLVYREDIISRPREQPMATMQATSTQDMSFTTTDLFRYSALTMNGHRIHYDHIYAREVEGYAGLVVHGPLLAQHLMLWAEQTLEPLASFSFRAVSPVMDHESITLCMAGDEMWVRGPDGRLCMTAQTGFAGQ